MGKAKSPRREVVGSSAGTGATNPPFFRGYSHIIPQCMEFDVSPLVKSSFLGTKLSPMNFLFFNPLGEKLLWPIASIVCPFGPWSHSTFHFDMDPLNQSQGSRFFISLFPRLVPLWCPTSQDSRFELLAGRHELVENRNFWGTSDSPPGPGDPWVVVG